MEDVRIHTEFPGGNVKVKEITPNKIVLEQDLRDTPVWWFYWSFCIENAQNREICFEFTNGEVVGPWGPAISRDMRNWSWAGSTCAPERNSFTYRFNPYDVVVYFSFCIPYLSDNFKRLTHRIGNCPYAALKTLAKSEGGRDVPLLQIGKPHAEKDIILTSRHHACEAPGSYVLDGVVDYLAKVKCFPENYAFHIVPFIDIDGVERGDQGKSRNPHDHNRDYSETPIYKSTSALIEYIDSLNLIAGIDFHAPMPWGKANDYPFFVKQSSPVKEETEKLSRILADITRYRQEEGLVCFTGKYDIDPDVDWNETDIPKCSTFMCKKGAKLAFTLEFPYFGIGSTVLTPEKTRKFGEDFAMALLLYLEDTNL